MFYTLYENGSYLKITTDSKEREINNHTNFFEIFAFRYNFSSRSKTQPQHRGGKCWWFDWQFECKREPHGSNRGHPGQPEWDGQHHGAGWSQYHREPVRKCHGELLQQVRKLCIVLFHFNELIRWEFWTQSTMITYNPAVSGLKTGRFQVSFKVSENEISWQTVN